MSMGQDLMTERTGAYSDFRFYPPYQLSFPLHPPPSSSFISNIGILSRLLMFEGLNGGLWVRGGCSIQLFKPKQSLNGVHFRTGEGMNATHVVMKFESETLVLSLIKPFRILPLVFSKHVPFSSLSVVFLKENT